MGSSCSNCIAEKRGVVMVTTMVMVTVITCCSFFNFYSITIEHSLLHFLLSSRSFADQAHLLVIFSQAAIFSESVFSLLVCFFFVQQLKAMVEFFHQCEYTASILLGSSFLVSFKIIFDQSTKLIVIYFM